MVKSLGARSGWLAAALMVLLVGFGAGSRFHNLSERSLWADELFTLAIAQYHPFKPKDGHPQYRRVQVKDIADDDTFLTAKAAEQSPPLYELLEKISVGWLGPTEYAARLPAALFSCALLIWFAALALTHPDPWVRRVLKWSVLLLALYPGLILYAREGRAYGVGVSLIGMAGLLWMLRWRDGCKSWEPPGWTETAIFTLACLTHYNAALLVAILLSADAVMALIKRSSAAWARLIALASVFAVWLFLNAHAILYTAEGGVAWAALGDGDRFSQGVGHWLAIMHPLWVALLGVCLLFLGLCHRQFDWLQQGSSRLFWSRIAVLAGLSLLFAVLAGKVAAKAGMAHPRYFIFILPFIAVLMGIVFAAMRRKWLTLGLVALVGIAATIPSQKLVELSNTDDLRSMAISAVNGASDETVYLYPLVPIRNAYRVYLQRYLGHDPRPSMVGISSTDGIAQVCAVLSQKTHVVAMGHELGRPLTDAVYADCGKQWPMRESEKFNNTFVEHWRSR